MTQTPAACQEPGHPPIAILGVPFDPVTIQGAIARIERMIESRQPHYLVTANVDFLTQAASDVELRRIFLDSDLVICDGTPPLWASGWFGNRLPERVAGADVVPLLFSVAERRGYRLFFLGASPETASRAMANIRASHPQLVIAGQYSPPYRKLLEMDHEEIRRRILQAKPDLLFVCFGCPKQEKWIWMHYRELGVPVSVGVGATVDFLAGQFKRAPRWMRDAGLEWVFRLGQEPRRLFRRYLIDMVVFGRGMLRQWWEIGIWRGRRHARRFHLTSSLDGQSREARFEGRFDSEAWEQLQELRDAKDGEHLLLDLSKVTFIDSTGVGILMRLQKSFHVAGRCFVLVSPSPAVARPIASMRLGGFLTIAGDVLSARAAVLAFQAEQEADAAFERASDTVIRWRGELTAANASQVWELTRQAIVSAPGSDWTIVLDGLRFIDSSGLGLMVRVKKLAAENRIPVRFDAPGPQVQNVMRIARLEGFLMGDDLRPERRREPSVVPATSS